MRHLLLFISFLFFLSLTPTRVYAQFSERKDRKKMWKHPNRRHKKREAYNPYLSKRGKSKKTISNEMAKENKKALRKQKRAAKKQMKHNKKETSN